jgi:hypothetical protein
MSNWWLTFGRDSLITGIVVGLLVAGLSWWHRWSAVKQGKPSPARHGLLFAFDFLKTVSFFTLALTLSAMAAEKMIPRSLMWFLVVLIAVAMTAAVLLGQFAKDRYSPDDITGTVARPKSEPEPGAKA